MFVASDAKIATPASSQDFDAVGVAFYFSFSSIECPVSSGSLGVYLYMSSSTFASVGEMYASASLLWFAHAVLPPFFQVVQLTYGGTPTLSNVLIVCIYFAPSVRSTFFLTVVNVVKFKGASSGAGVIPNRIFHGALLRAGVLYERPQCRSGYRWGVHRLFRIVSLERVTKVCPWRVFQDRLASVRLHDVRKGRLLDS